MNTNNQRVCVIGIGRLGAPIAACLAAKGFQVVGVDSDAQRVASLNACRPPVFETGLDDMLTKTAGRLRATTDTAAAVRDSDVTFILVPTPSEPDGSFSLQYVLETCDPIGQALAKKKDFHLVVLVSTVMPGSTGGSVKQQLEQASGKVCGRDFGLCYSPEFVALGSVIKDYLHPDFILIGQSDPRSGDILAAVHDRVCETKPPKARMNFANAELAKIAVNSFITTKITYANMLAGICRNLPDADVDTVTSAIGLDSRIGRKYLTGGVGYGGPCFPRDNRAMASVAKSVGASADLAETVDRVNRQQVAELIGIIKEYLQPSDTVAVLGLAYKPHSNVVEQSQGLLLAKALADQGVSVTAHDPVAIPASRAVLGDAVRFVDDLPRCIGTADITVFMTPWPEYAGISTAAFKRNDRPRTVIDPWRFLASQPWNSEVTYVPGGVGPKNEEATNPAAGCLTNV